jgi:hypothetical protein
MCAGRPTSRPAREGEHRAEHFGAKRRADLRIRGGAAAQDAAEVQNMEHVAHGDLLGHDTGVATQRATGPERTGHHVSPPQ